MSDDSTAIKPAPARKRSSRGTNKRVSAPLQLDTGSIESNTQIVPYDETLYERARTQWQFGDWESLARLDRESLQHHPDRAKLALLAAAGHQQFGSMTGARQFSLLAMEWGCSRQLVSRILISGVHNTLGIASALVRTAEQRSVRHFQTALAVGSPGCATELLTRARIAQQLQRIAPHLQNALPAGLRPSPDAGSPQGEAMQPKTQQAVAESSPQTRLAPLVAKCVGSPDLYDEIDKTISSCGLQATELTWFYILLADHFTAAKDNLTAVNFLNTARDLPGTSNSSLSTALIKRFIALGKPDEAADFVLPTLLSSGVNELNEKEKDALQSAYLKARSVQLSKSEHGHEVLLAHLRNHWEQLQPPVTGRKPVLVEIGTTRENVPGQGSSRKIAEFCKAKGIHFITVDMDPHNTRMAAELFSKLEPSFEAVNMKGEDYLREYQGVLDFVFLDAYDFDHGKHSALRQSRYEKYIGSPINDADCHQMHLDCAQSVLKKLAPHGLVCIDDTWLDNGQWTAKGTLAMPFLLDNGFRLLDARNRAALLAPAQ